MTKLVERKAGVPAYSIDEIKEKSSDYCVLIPVINEGDRIYQELYRAIRYNITNRVDIIICDGKSTDGSMDLKRLAKFGVNTLLVKESEGRQGAQLRMGIHFALERDYKGIITIDGNHKDSIEDIPKFIKKLEAGFDFVQGSRFIKGGKAINTPIVRFLSVRLIHAPIISLTAGEKFTDSTNAYRAYSARYLKDEAVKPLRDIFMDYELLAYLSVRASQIGLKTCEVPVTRRYPKGQTPTKISAVKGNANLLKILIINMFGGYAPK